MKSKKLIITLAIILVIVLAAVIGGIIYFKNINNPKKMFYKHLTENLEAFIEDEEQVLEMAKQLKEKTSTTKGNITLKVENVGDDETSSILNKFNATFEMNIDPINKKESGNAKVNYDNEELFSADYLRTNDLYGIKLNGIAEKYIAVENNNLKEFARKLGIYDTDNIPDKIEVKNYEELFSLTDSEEKYIKEKYVSIINTILPDEKYIKEDKAECDVNGTSVEATAYVLNLTEADLTNIAKTILTETKNDQTILNIIKAKLDILGMKIEIADIQERIDDMLYDIDDSNSNDVLLQIVVFVKDDKNIKTEIISDNEKLELIYDIKSENDMTLTIKPTFTNSNSLDDNDIYTDTENQTDLDSIFNSENTTNETDNDAITDDSDDIDVSTNDMDLYGTEIKSIQINKQKNGDTETAKVTVLMNGNSTVEVTAESKNGLENKINVVVNLGEGKINVNIDYKTELGVNLNIEELSTDSNAVVLNKYSMYQIESLFNAIAKKAETVYSERINKIFGESTMNPEPDVVTNTTNVAPEVTTNTVSE